MRDLPPGWQTDLAILEVTGSTVQDRGDHLVVRTPYNPDYHWGNFVLVADERAVGDATRWVHTFEAAFPAADWTAVGLVRPPEDERAWAERGMHVETDDVLSTRELPRQTPLPAGYEVRRLVGDDWRQHAELSIAENARTGEYDAESYRRFVLAGTEARRSMSERAVGAFFGAFADGRLVADLGILRCGRTARYQSVGTHADHRRRGLASHLLGVAACWAADHGCDRWVIVTEETNPAGRVYRRLGFIPDVGSAHAYRPPALRTGAPA